MSAPQCLEASTRKLKGWRLRSFEGCRLAWSTETLPTHGLSLACASLQRGSFQEPGGSWVAFCDLTLEVM